MTRKLDKLVANAEHIADSTVDAWENLTSNQTDRTGHAATRVASALASGVDADVLALQMTNNSRKNNPEAPEHFTVQDISSIEKLHKANRTRSALPKAQVGGLIREQRAADDSGDAVPVV